MRPEERTSLIECLEYFKDKKYIGLDTETTGLYPYLGDRIFSIIIGDDKKQFYFDVCEEVIKTLSELFHRQDLVWFIHNAIFDLHHLNAIGVHLSGEVHCTKSGERLLFNDHLKYSLDASGERLGYKKDDSVKHYVTKNKLYRMMETEGGSEKMPCYNLVPREIIEPYAKKDVEICFALGINQVTRFLARSQTHKAKPISKVVENEIRLTQTIFRMENRGCKLDMEYVRNAKNYEEAEQEKAKEHFKIFTGKEYQESPKLFADVLSKHKDKWAYTDKGNPCFDSDSLGRFSCDISNSILKYREHKANANFFNQFLFFSDKDGVIHPSFNQSGTATGRFSSSEPNFQNLKKTDEEDNSIESPYPVRRAIVPRENMILLAPDYDQMEYRLMLDYAAGIVGRVTPLIKKVIAGLDVHEATAQIAGITRKQAKTVNFAVLYGSGLDSLAKGLGVGRDDAKRIRNSIFDSAPEIRLLIDQVTSKIKRTGMIKTWLGRELYFKDTNFAYKGPNYLIQGGCADITKLAMNRIDEYLLDKKSKMIMTIHDELVVEAHIDEVMEIQRFIKQTMENVYPSKFVPLTVGMSWSNRSLHDKIDGFFQNSIAS